MSHAMMVMGESKPSSPWQHVGVDGGEWDSPIKIQV